MGEAGRVADGDVAIGRTRAGRQVVDLLPRGRIWNVRGVRNQVVGFGVLAGHERRRRHPVLAQVLVVIGLVDEDVTVDVEHARVPGRHVELGVADRLARRRSAAEVVAVLAVIDLGVAAALDIDRVTRPDPAVGEDRVGLGVRPGFGGGGGDDRDLAEAEHLHEGRRGVIGDGHLDLLVVVARGSHRCDGVPALGVGHGVIDGRRVEG